MSIYSKEFSAIYVAFHEFAPSLWEESKPTVVLTDDKSVIRFFQTKAIPPSLWNAFDFVLQFNFKKTHIAGSINTAAAFFFRLELKVREKIHFKKREDVQTTHIDVTTPSSVAAAEEQTSSHKQMLKMKQKKQILQRKEQSWKKATEWVVNQEPSSLKPNIKEFTKIEGYTTSYSINVIRAKARIQVEQTAEIVLKNLKFEILGQPHEDVLLTTDRQFKRDNPNEDRIIVKDGLLFRKYYGETGSVKYYRVLIPKKLVNEILRSFHGEIGKHPGITKTIIVFRGKYYYPNMAQLIRERIMSCKPCLSETRVNNRLTRPFLQNPNEYITMPKDAMQIDFVPGLPQSSVYENFVTAMDVFSRYSFAYPTSNQDAKTIGKVTVNIKTKHAYLPTILISNKGTAFMSHVIIEVAGVLGINLKHATKKHAQTIGLLEWSHASIKQTLKIATGDRRSMWHKYVSIAGLNYNTSYHASFGCEPSRNIHGRIPYNVFEFKIGTRPQKNPFPDSQIVQDVLEQTKMISQYVRKNAMQTFIKWKAYYDRTVDVSKSKQADYVYVLQPKADHQGSKIPFPIFQGIGLYIIEEVLPNNN